MTYPHGGASQIWRDGDGVAHNPQKSQIRDLIGAIEDAVTALSNQVFSADPVYADTAAGLSATSEGQYFKVANDAPNVAYDIFIHEAGAVATFVSAAPDPTALQNLVDAHASLTDNPHSVTKTQVGLGSADNTSDADKPVSDLQEARIQAVVNASASTLAQADSNLQSQIDALAGGLSFAGAWSPSSGAFPAGAAQNDFYIASGDGTVDGAVFQQGDWLIAVAASPSTSTFSGNWDRGAYGPSSAAAEPLVVVASGQSNMDGAGDGGTMPPENPAVQMFDLTTREFRAVSYSTPIFRTSVNNGGPVRIPGAVGKNNLAFSFAHAAHEATGRPVYLVIVSNGGTHIGRWVGTDANSVAGYAGPWGAVGTEKPLYVELQNAVTEALALIGVSKIDAFLWHQGETKRPGYESPSDYETDFAALRTQLKAETWWSDSTQLIVGEQIIGSYYQTAESYNDIWRALNDNGDPYIKAVSGEGLAMNAAIASPDSVHYDGQSLYELGRRCWRAYLGDKTALARRADPETTVYGAKSLTYDWTGKQFNVAETIDPLLERIVDEKRPAPVRAGGGREAGQLVANNVSCTVVHNADGTFTVTPHGLVARNWSFDIEDYWQQWPGVTKAGAADNAVTITGLVDLTKREKLRLWLDADTSANLSISYTPYLNGANANADDLMEIDWGDGTVDTGLNRGSHSHTYASAYSGWVIVSLPGCCEITTVLSDDGRWRSPLSQFAHLSQLTYLRIGADNRMFGDMRDLPDSMVTCILQGNNICTWDFTDLPNLKNLTAQGANTINAPLQFAEMQAFTRLILDGADRTTDQIDNILIALSQIMTWDGTADVFLNYSGQAARSAASDAAVAELVARGVTVNVNT